jgi:hypothetical protein
MIQGLARSVLLLFPCKVPIAKKGLAIRDPASGCGSVVTPFCCVLSMVAVRIDGAFPSSAIEAGVVLLFCSLPPSRWLRRRVGYNPEQLHS